MSSVSRKGGMSPMHDRYSGTGARPKMYKVKCDTKVANLETTMHKILSFGRGYLRQGYSLLQEVLKNIEINTVSMEDTSLLVKGITHLFHISDREHLPKIAQECVDSSTLRSKVSSYITNIVKEVVDGEVATEFLRNILQILTHCCEILPTYSFTMVAVILPVTEKVIQSRKEYDCLKDKLNRLQEIQKEVMENIKEGKKSKSFDKDYREPPNNFRTLNVLPDRSDIIMDGLPFLRENVVYGPYRDTEHYLDVQFRLLREDFMLPLRNAINQYRQQIKDGTETKYLQDGRLYKNVYIREMVCENDCIATKIVFNVKEFSQVKWEKSNRLMSGSLVCLSEDGFQNMFFGVIVGNDADNKAKGIVSVKFDQHTLDILGENPFQEYEMIESVSYYENYQHHLKVLKEMKESNLPMKQYILNQKKTAERTDEPLYLRDCENVCYNMTSLAKYHKTSEHKKTMNKNVNLDTSKGTTIDQKRDSMLEPIEQQDLENAKLKCLLSRVKLLSPESWPSSDMMGLNESQQQALRHALTKEFSIIQGPPGTGKTFLGLKILEILLSNNDVWSPDTNPAILIVCYTNHALDQVLSGILDTVPKMKSRGKLIRIGGHQNSDERLLKCRLQTALRQMDNNDARMSIERKEKISDKITKNSEFLSAVISGVVYDSDMEKIIGCNIIEQLQNQYQDFRGGLKELSILVLWLSMAEQKGYVCEHTRRKVETQPSRNETFEDDNAEIIRTQPEGKEDKSKKKRKIKLYSEDFEGIILTVDDIKDSRTEYLVYQKKIPHFKDIMMHQLQQCDYMSANEKKTIKGNQLWQMKETDRWCLYRSWVLQYYESKCDVIREMCREYEEVVEEYNFIRKRDEGEIVRNANVIGMTTTGAAKNKHLLVEFKPRVIMVEEAAEVLEAHVVSTLTNSCEHLILIGDHQQLKPNPSTYTLAKEFKLDISLFERMVRNKMQVNQLAVQHRMRPSISMLLVPDIYKELENHPSVYQYPDIRGIKGNIFFVHHENWEKKSEESRSHSNVHEAEFATALCKYFLRQDYQPKDITVLTTYKGQQFLINEFLNKTKDLYLSKKTKEQLREEEKKKCKNATNKRDHDENLSKSDERKITVVTVDNYQGEENKIIILSLVRSNEEGIVGFLSRSNRVCVALSRAKHGFYAIGNMKQLKYASYIWNRILSKDKVKNLVVDSLPLICQNHPDVEINAKCGKDFSAAPHGGCSRPCETRLDCGHACTRQCHPYDSNHKYFICEKPCPQICPHGHECKKKCYQCFGSECLCSVIVERLMPECGHVQQMQCYANIEEHICQIQCQKTLKCSHMCNTVCGKPCTIKCERLVNKILNCGHEKVMECHLDPGKEKCQEVVNVEMKTCGVHNVDTTCCKAEEVANSPCKVQSKSVCPSNSDHVTYVECCKVDKVKCRDKCGKLLDCGHKCSQICSHCYSLGNHLTCSEMCGFLLPCNHKCQGKCSICKEGQHPPCKFQLNKTSFCGHECLSICSSIPAKCTKECERKCYHGACKKKCGDLCVPCRKPCEWSCLHCQCTNLCSEPCNRKPCDEACQKELPCGHQCSGYCGEPCPDVCVQCDWQKLNDAAKILHYIIRRTSRFVKIHPCNHVIEGFYMDKHIESEQKAIAKTKYVRYFECPQCRGPVLYCPRYTKAMRVIETKITEVKTIIIMENNKTSYLLAATKLNGPFATLELSFLVPTLETMLKAGIICCLRTTLNLYCDIEKNMKQKADDRNHRIFHTERQVPIGNVCDINALEMFKARRYATFISGQLTEDCKFVMLKNFAVLAMEMLFRAKIASLDMLIEHDVKRNEIFRMANLLQDLEYYNYQNVITRTLGALKEVSDILSNQFTLKQRDEIPSLIDQVKHFFTPACLVKPGIDSVWKECSQGIIHYAPCNDYRLRFSNNCFMCKHYSFIQPLTDYKALSCKDWVKRWHESRMQFIQDKANNHPSETTGKYVRIEREAEGVMENSEVSSQIGTPRKRWETKSNNYTNVYSKKRRDGMMQVETLNTKWGKGTEKCNNVNLKETDSEGDGHKSILIKSETTFSHKETDNQLSLTYNNSPINKDMETITINEDEKESIFHKHQLQTDETEGRESTVPSFSSENGTAKKKSGVVDCTEQQSKTAENSAASQQKKWRKGKREDARYQNKMEIKQISGYRRSAAKENAQKVNKKEEANNGILCKEKHGNVLSGKEEIGSYSKHHKQGLTGNSHHKQELDGKQTQHKPESYVISHHIQDGGGRMTHHKQECGAISQHRQELASKMTHCQQEVGNSYLKQEKGDKTIHHKQELGGNVAFTKQELGGNEDESLTNSKDVSTQKLGFDVPRSPQGNSLPDTTKEVNKHPKSGLKTNMIPRTKFSTKTPITVRVLKRKSSKSHRWEADAKFTDVNANKGSHSKAGQAKTVEKAANACAEASGFRSTLKNPKEQSSGKNLEKVKTVTKKSCQ